MTSYLAVQPLTAGILSAIVLDESLGLMQLAGMVGISLGLATVIYARHKELKQEAAALEKANVAAGVIGSDHPVDAAKDSIVALHVSLDYAHGSHHDGSHHDSHHHDSHHHDSHHHDSHRS